MPRPRATNSPTIALSKFMGMNTDSELHELLFSEMRDIVDAFVTDRRRIRTRDGTRQLLAGNFHSIGGDEDTCLVVKDQSLGWLSGSNDFVELRSGLQKGAELSYVSTATGIFYSNGTDRGVVVDKRDMNWGMDIPYFTLEPVQPGSLAPGKYLITITVVDENGVESGAAYPCACPTAPEQAIKLQNFLLPPEAEWIRVYMTPLNSESLLRVAEIPATDPSYTISNPKFTSPLETLGLMRPPASDLMAEHYGRIYLAVGSAVWFTEAFRPHLINPQDGFLQFKAPVTLIAPVKEGIYISADETYFLRGTTPGQFVTEKVSPSRAVKGTLAYAPPNTMGGEEGNPYDTALWISDRGIMAGSFTGLLDNLTEGRVSFDTGDKGSGAFIQHTAATQYVSTMPNARDGKHNWKFQDRVVAEVYRNGVLLEE